MKHLVYKYTRHPHGLVLTHCLEHREKRFGIFIAFLDTQLLLLLLAQMRQVHSTLYTNAVDAIIEVAQTHAAQEAMVTPC